MRGDFAKSCDGAPSLCLEDMVTKSRTPPAHPSSTEVHEDHRQLDAAISNAVDFIRGEQLRSGAWISEEYFEPRTSAVHLITMAFVDRLGEVDKRGHAQFLATLQNDDGSFPPYPLAPAGDLSATALVFAALHVADRQDQHDVRQRALEYIETNGGFDRVLDLLFERGDLGAVYVAMAGLLDPFALPDPDLTFMVVPGALDLILKRINAGVVQVMIFVGAVTRSLRSRIARPNFIVHQKHRAEAVRCAEFFESWLNPNGNNNGTTVQTDMAIAALVALGRSPESSSVYAAISWFEKHKIWDDRGLHLRAFFNHNWMTSLCLRALLFAGVPRDDPMIGNALDFLCWSQSQLPMPEVNLARPDAHRTGGWGFEDDNLILPDTDDTGTVLGALGIALRAEGDIRLPDDCSDRVRGAVDHGLLNLLDMQSDNGGWAGFVYNLGDKPAGPIFDEPLFVPTTVSEKLQMFVAPPVELGEPAVSGLTGRVLQGLGALGFTPRSHVVRRAAAFLQNQQTEVGAWWGRWFVAYLPATACALSGLADCGWDMKEPWIERATTWLLSKQNEDGGWGETPRAYDFPAMAGVGPSMPPLTAHVLIGLIDAGLHEHPAVEAGIDYLIRTQQADGRWPSNGWLQVYEPNSTYYFYDGAAWYAPLEALAKFRRRHRPRRSLAVVHCEVVRGPRTQSDPIADTVIEELRHGSGQSSYRQAVAAVTTLDAPLPSSLPEPAAVYFSTTSALPRWADRKKIKAGQALFARHTWVMSAGLLCSALPQSYAAANGARVLAHTGRMTRSARTRILNTAGFLFDVCEPGGLGARGRGIRSAQKVRLMHAAVRAMVLRKSDWDTARWGVPINQEDLLATTLSFSVVLLDAMDRVGITVDDRDRDAFIHLWMVVGHLLGLDESTRPSTTDEAEEAMHRIRGTEWCRSPHGRLLAQQLVSCMRHYFVGRSRRVPRALIRFFAGDVCADLLNLKHEPTAAAFLHTAAATPLIARVLEPMLQGMAGGLARTAIDVQRGGTPTRFGVPSRLFGGRGLRD